MLKLILKYRLIFMALLVTLSACGESGESDDSNNNQVNVPVDGTALLSWTAPTRNSDGSDLLDLAGYRILYGTSPSNLDTPVTINDPTSTSYLVENLSSETWYFAMVSFNSSGTESSYSTVVSKIIN